MKLVVRKFQWTLFCGAAGRGQKVGPSAMHQCFGGTSHQSVQIAIHKPKIRCHRDQQRFLAVGPLWLRKNTLMSTSKMFYTGNLEVLKIQCKWEIRGREISVHYYKHWCTTKVKGPVTWQHFHTTYFVAFHKMAVMKRMAWQTKLHPIRDLHHATWSCHLPRF